MVTYIYTHNENFYKLYLHKPQHKFDKINIYFDQLYDIINVREPDSQFIIVGDFNISCIDWVYSANKCEALNYEGRMANELINTLISTELSQVNSIKNHYNRILDLILTNMNNIKVTRTTGIVNEDLIQPSHLNLGQI